MSLKRNTSSVNLVVVWISWGHSSLLYVWWQLYRERGEAAFVPTQAFQSPPEIDRPQTAQEQIAYLERLCGQQAMELDLLKSEVDVLKKAWHLLPSKHDTL